MKARVICFNENTGHGRLKLLDEVGAYLDYVELWFSYSDVVGGRVPEEAEFVEVELGERLDSIYVKEVRLYEKH